jgi:uncharacterized membrane protein
MTHVRLAGHFDAPIDQVFELATDFKRYPEWNVSYTDVQEISGPTDQVGTRIHAFGRLLGRPSEGWIEVIEVDRPRFIKMKLVGSDAGTVVASYRFTPQALGTDGETEIDYELPAGFLGEIADKLFVERAVDRDLRHSLENFKALVETKVAVPA